MSDREMQWRQEVGSNVAHLVAVNRDDPTHPRAAAVCGYGHPGMKPYRPAKEWADPCPRCLAMEKSGKRIVFRDPNSSRTTIIKEG